MANIKDSWSKVSTNAEVNYEVCHILKLILGR